MSVNIKQNGELVKIANNVSIVQADWNDRENTNKNTSIKNQPETIKTMADLEACEDENSLAGAMAVKEAINFYNICQNNAANISTLEECLELFATDTYVHDMCYIKDTGGWGPLKTENTWYMVSLISTNSYTTTQQFDTYINGIIWSQKGEMWSLYIKGKKGGTATVKYTQLDKPTITSRADLMANTVSGFFPDALAVKDSVNWISSKVNYNGSIIMGEIMGTGVSKCFQEMGITQDNTIDEVASIIGVYGNHYTKRCLIFTNSNSSNFSNSLPVHSGSFINMYLQGNNSNGRHYIELYDYRTGDIYKKYVMDGVASEWIPDSDVKTVESIDPSNVTITLNNIATNAGLTASDFSFDGSIQVVHAGGLNHSISFGITCGKSIPEGTTIELAFSNINFKKSLSDWGMHPIAKAYAELKNDGRTIRCIYDKTVNAGFAFWPVIPYTSTSRLRTVQL